jgi:hypothetical protein
VILVDYRHCLIERQRVHQFFNVPLDLLSIVGIEIRHDCLSILHLQIHKNIAHRSFDFMLCQPWAALFFGIIIIEAISQIVGIGVDLRFVVRADEVRVSHGALP